MHPARAPATTATDALIERANATGDVLFTRTVLDGAVALRFSIGSRDHRVAPRRRGLARSCSRLA